MQVLCKGSRLFILQERSMAELLVIKHRNFQTWLSEMETNPARRMPALAFISEAERAAFFKELLGIVKSENKLEYVRWK